MSDSNYVCSECGSDDVQTKYWCDANTLEVKDVIDNLEIDDCWCNKCNEHYDIITQDEYEEK